jgi:nicotinamide-nucleotide amidase
VATGGPRALLLSIGSELLVGETLDTNAAFLGAELARLGAVLRSVRSLPDERATIAAAFREALSGADLVLATGGLGPTHDDLTREGLADALDEKLVPDSELEAELRQRFAAYGRMPESNLRQALRIASAETLPNPIGSAPGWWVTHGESAVAIMPGVPSEMRRMWSEQVAPRIRERLHPTPIATRTVKTFGIGESAVADLLGDMLAHPGDGVTAGIYARDDGVHLRFSTPSDAAVLSPLAERAAELLADHVWGTGADDLASTTLATLGRRGLTTLASWEADTEGTLLAILSAAEERAGSARYVGGMLDLGAPLHAPLADAVLQVSLLPQDAHGRSRVRVAMAGTLSLPMTELRVHGSGPQRLRRAAFAALNEVRRTLP